MEEDSKENSGEPARLDERRNRRYCCKPLHGWVEASLSMISDTTVPARVDADRRRPCAALVGDPP